MRGKIIGFTHRLTILDKEGRKVRDVLAKSEDELKRMKHAFYWTFNHRLKMAFTYVTTDLEEEKKIKEQKLKEALTLISAKNKRRPKKYAALQQKNQADYLERLQSTINELGERLKIFENRELRSKKRVVNR